MKSLILIFLTSLAIGNSKKTKHSVPMPFQKQQQKKFTQIVVNRHKHYGADEWPGTISGE